MDNAELTLLKKRFGPKIVGKVNTIFSSDLGKLYPSDKPASRAIQLSFANRCLAYRLGIRVVRQASRESYTQEELDSIVYFSKGALIPIQSILIRTSPEHRIWMIYNNKSMLYTFVKSAIKPLDFFGPRLPENWDKDSAYLMEGQYDIWSSIFYTKFLELCKKMEEKPSNLDYIFSDDESLEAMENADYLNLLQNQLGLLPNLPTDNDNNQDDGDVKMEEVEEYNVEADFTETDLNVADLNVKLIDEKDEDLSKNFLLRHTSLTAITQKIVAFIQDECHNNCSLFLLHSALNVPYAIKDIVKESIRLKTPLVILFNKEIYVEINSSKEDKSKEKPLFKSRIPVIRRQ